VLAVALLTAGCSAPRPHPSPPQSGNPGKEPKAGPTVRRSDVLPRVLLTANAKERPARWELRFFVPFGDAPSALGFKTFPEGAPSEPYSFGVAPDNSVWIADRLKFRLAHYSQDGKYLGQVLITPGDRGNRLWDVIFVDKAMFAATVYQLGRLEAVTGRGSVSRFTVKSNGRALFINELFSTRIGLVALTGGYSDSLLGPGPQAGPFGYVRIDTPTGSATEIPGLPLDRDQFFRLESSGGDQDFAATYLRASSQMVQPIRFKYTRDGSRSIRAVVGVGGFIPVGEDVVSFVQLSADRPRYDHDGGRWLLRLGRNPILWERLPFSPIDDSVQWRHIAVGPDGAIYLMLAMKGGEEILRRP
jgi:hypothetical protein